MNNNHWWKFILKPIFRRFKKNICTYRMSWQYRISFFDNFDEIIKFSIRLFVSFGLKYRGEILGPKLIRKYCERFSPECIYFGNMANYTNAPHNTKLLPLVAARNQNERTARVMDTAADSMSFSVTWWIGQKSRSNSNSKIIANLQWMLKYWKIKSSALSYYLKKLMYRISTLIKNVPQKKPEILFQMSN